MVNIIGTKANDTLQGTNSDDTINGKAGNDTITAYEGKDTLTGGGGNDTFVFNIGDGTDTITDFSGVGKKINPTPAVIGKIDTIKFLGAGLIPQNLLLTQNGTSLEISFEGLVRTKVILKNFKLEDLNNLKASGTKPAIGNILFDGQTSITDSFNVLDANSTDTSIGIKNTVTFANDLNNNITGLDDSNDVVNGQGGNDIINGLSGDDLLRGGTGNDTLIGGIGNDTLVAGTRNYSLFYNTNEDNSNVNYSLGDNLLDGGDGNDFLSASGYVDYLTNDVYYTSGNNTFNGGAGNDILNIDSSIGNNTLNGGAGADILYAQGSQGNNLLSGGEGNDILYASYLNIDSSGRNFIASLGNDTLNGGAGDDTLLAESPLGKKLLSGGDGNDYLSTSGIDGYRSEVYFSSSGNNTLNGGAGNDTLRAEYSTGNNLLSGDEGNDYLSISGYLIEYFNGEIFDASSGNNTLNGGAGNDTLRAEYSTGNNLLSGGDGNDSFYVNAKSSDTAPSNLVTQTVDGGKGDDLLRVDYSNATGGITTTFNSTTNIGSITAGISRVSYKNIERLNISGTAYDDNIVGSNSNDTLSGGVSGKDTIDGGKGDDLLFVDYTNATGRITTTFNATTNIGSITAGTNLVSYKNIEELNILGTAYDDNIVGNNGNDTLSPGSGGKDTIDGGKGDDVLYVDYTGATGGITTTFNPTTNIGSIMAGTNLVSYKNIEQLNITGTGYSDFIVGSNGNDTIKGISYDSGNDTIIGGAGNDSLSASSSKGNNTLNGSAGDDHLDIGSSSGDNFLDGGDGNDTLSAIDASGKNTLKGGNGNDILIGGYGNDSLYGGSGIDTFVFNSYDLRSNTGNRVYDFNATNDVIGISAAGFGEGLSIGSLSANQFQIGASATTGDQKFIYNNITGALLFDPDGTGESSQVQFAQLSPGLPLTNNNFVIV
ncbi:beta strand repeat-containing protein [Nostoc sp.]|uniref:beta strand repeat-containing protein n=1 Tax=Nostoc sp. TaxID=1180 RepID=UPI002FF692D8